MSDRYQRLNKLEQHYEVLTILMEECAEVTQAASKCIRFKNGDFSNVVSLSNEIGDLLAVVELLYKYSMVDVDCIEKNIETKKEKLKFYSNLPVE
jgi:NTP pyrophosphatase (non-canonical NTP hydrolase)